MVNEKEFSNVIYNAVRLLLEATGSNCFGQDMDIPGRLSKLLTGKNGEESSLLAFIEEADKATLRSNMEKDIAFMTLLPYINRDIPLTVGEIAGNLGMDMESFAASDYALLVKAFCIEIRSHGLYYFHKALNWSDYWNHQASPVLYASILFAEILGDISIPMPSDNRTPSFSDMDEIEDIISYLQDRRIGWSYRDTKSQRRDSFKGKTGTGHLKAEEWGFSKDQLLIALISEYGYDYRLRKKKDVKDIIEAWCSETYLTIENDFFLTNLKLRKAVAEHMVILPYFRWSLVTLLSSLKPGMWYDTAALWKSYRASTAPIQGNDLRHPLDYTTSISADMLCDNDDKALYRHTDELFRRPVFAGMLYILALLGCLDITEKDPPLTMKKTKTRKIPYSPCDCLDAVRINALGAWVFGLSDNKPEIKKEFSAPVADKDLLLITYKGKDIRIRSFLSEIADPLGEIRYKVTLSSFTSSAENKEDCRRKIEKFKSLISDEPSQNWMEFFDKAIKSYDLMNSISQGSLLQINDMETFNNLLDTTPIGSLVLRCENGMIYLPETNKERFMTILNKSGYRISTRRKNATIEFEDF